MAQPWMIYVLNLDRAPERWRGCQRRLKRLGIERSMVERVAGLDALALWKEADGFPDRNPRILERLVEEGMIREGEVPHLGPNFCIAASHLRVLRRVRDDGPSWAIVLEDDFELTEACGSRDDLFRFDAFPSDAEWVWLHDRMWAHRGNGGVFRRAVGGHGMIAYAVSFSGSKTARDALLPIVAPCDLQLSAFTSEFHRPEVRDRYVLSKFRQGWRTRQAEEALSLRAYVRSPPLFTHRRGPSLKHQAADAMYAKSVR